ncbi:Putative rRNA methylase [Proteiniborus ethanoligenes]|uniref:Putative rRNA methylase n=1 Tax=Proteiniborus ethanoligenes TaxID=415015 RepID=A0A1H3NBA5_9FIRM|nr:class I SAM-dependent methyltransferase [Proteiniborus ethanoligenes]SDY86241.1 Putative rRNA methylase [Proteiniborus ethanoligenes]
MYKYFNNVTKIAKELMVKTVQKGNIVVDATVGNGHDTLLLANLVGGNGKVYGFDIQDSAIENTRLKLVQNHVYERVILIKDSHESMDKYILEKVDFIIFNLGYLPGGNHEINTKAETTIAALEKSLELLKENGLLLVTTYPGHRDGKIEDEYIKKTFSRLDQKKFNILKFEFINQINNPPILYGVEKNN